MQTIFYRRSIDFVEELAFVSALCCSVTILSIDKMGIERTIVLISARLHAALCVAATEAEITRHVTLKNLVYLQSTTMRLLAN